MENITKVKAICACPSLFLYKEESNVMVVTAEDAESVIKLEFPCLGLHLYSDTKVC